MATSVSRRTILTTGAVAATGLSLPGTAAYAGGRPPSSVGFVLNAEVLDGGEQVTSITLDTGRYGPIDRASLTTGTFTVHAAATSPIPVVAPDVIFSEYDVDRTVTAVRVDRRGDVVIELASGEGQVGGATLGYILSRARNVQLDLTYTITQNAPITLKNKRPVTVKTFVQGRLSSPEVDAFSYRTSRSGLKYRLYSPPQGRGSHTGGRGRRPLILWLHGGGEGASLGDGYYDNETTLRANRGALGFATAEGQRIFGSAYVVAPQSTSFWLEDGPRFAPLLREIVADLARRYSIDRDRIYVAGCSNGGYMSLKMTSVYPDLFAASVPVCGVVTSLEPGGPTQIPDAELRAIRTPTWLVASRDDTTVDPIANTVHANELIPRSLMTLYDDVTWKGYRFPGHWSWIYLARNDPRIDGTRVWQWMARQRR